MSLSWCPIGRGRQYCQWEMSYHTHLRPDNPKPEPDEKTSSKRKSDLCIQLFRHVCNCVARWNIRNFSALLFPYSAFENIRNCTFAKNKKIEIGVARNNSGTLLWYFFIWLCHSWPKLEYISLFWEAVQSVSMLIDYEVINNRNFCKVWHGIAIFPWMLFFHSTWNRMPTIRIICQRRKECINVLKSEYFIVLRSKY